MSAVWRASRGAVRRRKLQTLVIGVVVFLSTAMIVLALGLLAASAGPFDQAFAQQDGAHLVAAFDTTKVSDAQVAATATTHGVQAAAGPFDEATLSFVFGVPPRSTGPTPPATPLTVVGRSGAGGAVDRLNLWHGRWPSAADEIVLNQIPGTPLPPTDELDGPNGVKFTIVGYAYSVTGSADAWVTPAQMTALQPTGVEMLYRFDNAATTAQMASNQASVTAGLPSDALIGARSYLAVKTSVASTAGIFVPFLGTFGILGLAVAILIVANVVSGAVVAGFRHIGILKSIGFTPSQVMGVYLGMVSVPAIVGTLLGTVLGNIIAVPLLDRAFQNYGVSVGIAPWVDVAAIVGMPAIVVLTAAIPSLRARSLSANQAISAGSATRKGRGIRAQRSLAGSRLPRSVSLGLGLPFARPGRTFMTMAAVVLGVTSATFAVGLAQSLAKYQNAENRRGSFQIQVIPLNGASPVTPKLTDDQDEALLQSLPGAESVLAEAQLKMRVVGEPDSVDVSFIRGDPTKLGFFVLSGHMPTAADEAVVSGKFLIRRGLSIGDTLTLTNGGQQTQVKIVGALLLNAPDQVVTNWQTLASVAPNGARAYNYFVQLKSGTDEQKYIAAFEAAEPGLHAETVGNNIDGTTVVVASLASLLALMVGLVAGLGVFNTVVLNTRERRRDLGVLKAIGMTPRQVTVMMVASMSAIGAIGGIIGVPLGVAVQRSVVPSIANAGQIVFPEFMIDIYRAPVLILLGIAGIVIAALGALIPARSAARATIAQVLHNE